MIAVAQSEPQSGFDVGIDVEDIVGRLRDLRSLSQRRRYSGPTPSLPSRKTVIAAFDDLVCVLYPRNFGPQGLSTGEIDAFVGKTLASALRALQAVGFAITSIRDVTPIPHNGCRPRKRRRV